MAVKHVQEYYKQIREQYSEMLELVADVEKEVEAGTVDEDRLSRIEEQVNILKTNYERWSYMMFLLHQPARKSKKARYQKQQHKMISNMSFENTIDSQITENNNVLASIKE